MSDDIDVLGSSLLNRQRVTRKRTEKRLKRDTRNQALLNIGATGVRIANKYLQDRARNFVDNNEELAGQRMLYNKALKNKTRLLNEYDLAQANPAGELDWLATTKFAPIIQNNLTSTFSTEGYSQRDINRWVKEKALEEAKKYQGSWNKSIEEALKMGTIDDYDAYVASNDGRAENVGGFLFNKISRSLNDKTQEDVDTEMLESFKNNRFGNNARQLNYFNGLTRAGLDHNVAADLAKKGGSDTGFTNRGTNPERFQSLSDLGINPAEIIKTELSAAEATFYKGGIPYKIPVNKYTYTMDDAERSTKEVIGPRTRLTEDGETQIVQEQLWRMYEGSQEGLAVATSDRISPNDPDSSTSENDIIARGLRDGTFRADPPISRGRKNKGRYNRPGTEYEVQIFSNEIGQAEAGKPLYTQTYFEPDEALTYDEKFGNIEDSYVSEAKGVLQRIAGTLTLTSGETVLELDLINRYFAGSNKRYEELEDDGVDFGDLFKDNITALSKYIAIDAEQYENIFGLNRDNALELATASHLSSMITGWNPDTESVIEDANAISRTTAPASSILYSIATLENSTTPFEGIAQENMGAIVTEAYKEVTELFSTPDPKSNLLANKIADTLLNMEGLKDVRILKTDFDDATLVDDIEASGREANNNGEFTLEQIFSYIAGKPVVEVSQEKSIEDSINQRLLDLRRLQSTFKGEGKDVPAELEEEIAELQAIWNESFVDGFFNIRDRAVNYLKELKEKREDDEYWRSAEGQYELRQSPLTPGGGSESRRR